MGSYVPNTLEERKKMLQEIGYSSIEDLFAHIPEEVKLKGELNIPKGKTEFEVRREMEQIAERTRCSGQSSAEPELTDILSRPW